MRGLAAVAYRGALRNSWAADYAVGLSADVSLADSLSNAAILARVRVDPARSETPAAARPRTRYALLMTELPSIDAGEITDGPIGRDHTVDRGAVSRIAARATLANE